MHGRYGPVTVLRAYYGSGSGELWVPPDELLGIEFGQTAVGEYHLAQCAGQGPAPRSGPLPAPADYRQRWRHQSQRPARSDCQRPGDGTEPALPVPTGGARL